MKHLRVRDYPILPNCKANHASVLHAIKFKVCNESFLSAPKSAIIDGIISYGGSTSVGSKLPCKAFGEFYERNHLFTQVPITQRKPLREVAPDHYRNKLLALCNSKNKTQEQILNHTFAFTRIFNYFDDQAQDYFYNAVSLNCNPNDSAFINFSDSCACASHPEKDKALYNSLMEFIERQALLGSWLSKTYQYRINAEVLRQISPYTDLVGMFLTNGELYIFQNGNDLPGHTVIMFYFSHSEKDLVQYSIGSSSGLTIEEAINSSFEELYQCYSFLYNSESSEGLENKAGSGYHLEFQKCNHSAIRETIPFMDNLSKAEIESIEDLNALPRFTLEQINSALFKLSPEIYYYHKFDKSLGLHYTKLLSPDFFVHMALNSSLNISNSYAHRLNITPENAFLGKIPFP